MVKSDYSLLDLELEWESMPNFWAASATQWKLTRRIKRFMRRHPAPKGI